MIHLPAPETRSSAGRHPPLAIGSVHQGWEVLEKVITGYRVRCVHCGKRKRTSRWKVTTQQCWCQETRRRRERYIGSRYGNLEVVESAGYRNGRNRWVYKVLCHKCGAVVEKSAEQAQHSAGDCGCGLSERKRRTLNAAREGTLRRARDKNARTIPDSPYWADMTARAMVSMYPDGATLEMIGAVYGLSRERIRQIERGALRKLKQLAERDPELRVWRDHVEKLGWWDLIAQGAEADE